MQQIQVFQFNLMELSKSQQSQDGQFHQLVQPKRDKIHKQAASVPSEHFEEYHRKMLFYDSLINAQIITLGEKMAKSQVKYKKQQNAHRQKGEFKGSLNINIKNQTINKEVVVLSIQWGHFQFEAKILNITEQNKQHGISTSNGCYGKIYQGAFMNSKIAIKCIPVKSQSTRFNAIKEWFLLKIASAAQFGPKLLSCFGFDILMFQTCCEFAMEVCQTPMQKVNSQHMLWNLAMMHRLHMVHLDIKPQNIMLSRSFQKPVFIDFGLSKLIAQNPGQKSLTPFFGTYAFCSEEMTKCYLNKSRQYVDLYMNDLHALNKSLKFFFDIQEKQQEKENTSKVLQKQISYLYLALMKFYLYQSSNELFFDFLATKAHSQEILFYRKEALLFLLQLPPTNKRKEIFLRIEKESQIQSDLYSKIKGFFELSFEKICSVNLFKDDKKHQQLSQVCLQFQNQEIEESIVEQNHAREIHQLLINPKLIQKLPFQDYVGNYLQYLNFLNNKYEVTSQNRKKVATVYYSLFISKETPQQLTGKQLIKQTILHILQWGLQSEKLSESADLFALFAFRIYDFLVILYSESSAKFITLVQHIFNHSSLFGIYQHLFLERVKHSHLIIIKQLLLGSQQSRIQFGKTVLDWAKLKQKQLQISRSLPKLQDKKKLQQQSQQKDIVNLNQQFKKQFGIQIISYLKIASQQKTWNNFENLMDLFNKLNYELQIKRVFYFLFDLYEQLNVKRMNKMLSKAIYGIFKANINDDEVLSQFIFVFEQEVIFKLLNSSQDQINKQTLQNIINHFSRIHKNDMFFIKHQIVGLFQKILSLQNTIRLSKKEDQISALNVLIQRICNYFTESFWSQLFENQQSHQKISVYYLYQQLYFMKCQNYLTQNKFYEAISSQEVIKKIQCKNCQFSAYLSFQLFKLVLSLQKINLSAIQNVDILQPYYTYSSKIVFSILMIQQPIEMLNCMELVLRMGQIICCIHPSIQEKYQGLAKYYQFAINCNCIYAYFKEGQQDSFPIYYTLLLFFEKHYEKCIAFLINLVSVVERNMIQTNFNIITIYCTLAISRISQNQLTQLFIDLKSSYFRMSEKTNCVAILYTIIFNLSSSEQQQRKVLAAIMKVFHKLHSHIQRKLSLDYVLKILQNIEKRPELSRRHWLYCNNKAVKLLMIEGKSIPAKLKVSKYPFQSKKFCLSKKISNIHEFNHQNLKIKLRKK